MQNYVTPLRLVLSPADMVAIFINLEVRVRPGLVWGAALLTRSHVGRAPP